MISDLMKHWGYDRGLSRNEVLDALYANKYNKRNNFKRFTILPFNMEPSRDDYIIKVHSKEDRGTPRMPPWISRRQQKHYDDETHDKDPEPMYPYDEETNDQVHPDPMYPDGGETHDQDSEPKYPDEKDPLWVQYEDLNNMGTFWWYYEGPLGKFFMPDGDTKPQKWFESCAEPGCDTKPEHEKGLHYMNEKA